MTCFRSLIGETASARRPGTTATLRTIAPEAQGTPHGVGHPQAHRDHLDASGGRNDHPAGGPR
jgi:hypothetical protein